MLPELSVTLFHPRDEGREAFDGGIFQDDLTSAVAVRHAGKKCPGRPRRCLDDAGILDREEALRDLDVEINRQHERASATSSTGLDAKHYFQRLP